MRTDKRKKAISKHRLSRPKTAKEYFALSEKQRATWSAVTQGVLNMKTDKRSASRAAHEVGLPPKEFIRLARPALRKTHSGRYVAKRSDKLLRVLVVPTKSGVKEIATTDSREASLLAKYWAAVHKYLATGDEAALKKIRRKTIVDALGKRVRLVKDLAELERLGSAGEFRFESIYARAA